MIYLLRYWMEWLWAGSVLYMGGVNIPSGRVIAFVNNVSDNVNIRNLNSNNNSKFQIIYGNYKTLMIDKV